jgi:membrane-bound lytic murein transglycosylase D
MSVRGALWKSVTLLISFSFLIFPAKADPFVVPSRLRARVEFWRRVFTVHDNATVIFHHRDFPYVIFKIISLENYRSDPNLLSVVRTAIEKRYSLDIRQSMERLSRGDRPLTPLDQQIVKAMSFLGSGTEKYHRFLNEDLLRTQTGIRDKYGAAITRSGRYLPMMESIFRQYGLPVELTRLPFIESSFDYTAYSKVGAAGIWQFMPTTGRLYMTVNSLIDERRDPLSATHGAAKYLKSAYDRLDKWPLAVTSYNHGVAGVARRISEAGTDDLGAIIEDKNRRYFGFASTNFYPEFLAAVEIYRNWRKYFPHLRQSPPVRFFLRKLSHPVNVRDVERAYGKSKEDLRGVNYAINAAIWNGKYPIPAGYELKIPLAGRQTPAQFANVIPPRTVNKKAIVKKVTLSKNKKPVFYTVKKGDTITGIAKRFKKSGSDLMRLNGKRKGDLLRAGERLKVY